MAALHAGITERFNCEVCEQNPEFKIRYGCESCAATNRSVFEIESFDTVYSFHNCPLLFISKSAKSFYNRYIYQKDYPSAPMPEYDNVSARWVQSHKIYEQSYFKYCDIVRESKK